PDCTNWRATTTRALVLERGGSQNRSPLPFDPLIWAVAGAGRLLTQPALRQTWLEVRQMAPDPRGRWFRISARQIRRHPKFRGMTLTELGAWLELRVAIELKDGYLLDDR